MISRRLLRLTFLLLSFLPMGCRLANQSWKPSPRTDLQHTGLFVAAERAASNDQTPGKIDSTVLDLITDKPFVIEFDDEGELWQPPGRRVDRAGRAIGVGASIGSGKPPAPGEESGYLGQLDAARQAIRMVKRTGREVTLVIYVHGWRNNARDDSPNFEAFTELVRASRRLANNSEEPVPIGIYIGWRGTPLSVMRDLNDTDLVKVINEAPMIATFWNRLDTADRVGRPAFTQTVLSLAAEAKRGDLLPLSITQERKEKIEANLKAKLNAPVFKQSKVIIVGHSMGGRVVERAVAQAIIGSLFARAPVVIAKRTTLDENIKKSRELADAIGKNSKARPCLKTIIDDLKKRERAQEDARETLAGFTKAVAKAKEQLERDWKDAQDELNKIFVGYPGGLFPDAAKGAVVRQVRGEAWPDQKALTSALDDQVRLLQLLLAEVGSPKPAASTVDTDLAQERVTFLQGAIPNRAKKLHDKIASHQGPPLDQKIKDAEAAVATAVAKVTEVSAAETEVKQLNVELKRLQNESLTKAFEASQLRQEIAEPPADLVLLLNPASDSIFSRQIVEAMRDPLISPYFELANNRARPWLISVSSKKDSATTTIYKWGAIPSLLTRDYRPIESDGYNQFEHFSTPAPHNKHLQTHLAKLKFVREEEAKTKKPIVTGAVSKVLIEASGAPLDDDDKNFLPWLKLNLNETALTDALKKLLPNNPELPFADSPSITRAIFTPDGVFELVPEERALSQPGYWVINVDGRLIKDHNDIFTRGPISLIAGLLRMSAALEPRGLEE